jgi:alpha-1,3-rhamnosyl/mannosyltransferase
MPYRAGKPTLLTVYDLIPELFPTYVSRRARLFFRLSMRMALNGSSIVTTISKATRADLLTRYAVDDAKVRVIPLAPDPAFKPAPDAVVRAVRQRYDLAHQYVLYVGSNKPHKNLVRLLEAWAQLKSTIAADVVLAIAGHWDPRYPEARQKAEAPELAGRVVFCGPVAEEDLMPLMTGATAFVFPSEYEGFGLPVIEAMACGTAVACANRSSLPEVVGDAAALFAPDDVTDMAAALRRLLADSQWRQDLAEKGLARAGQFSWERTAAATLELYRGLAQ